MIKCVVPISGGKDSQACAKLAVAEFGADSVLGLFCDTKFEHELTYQHVKKIGQMYGITIITICAGSVEEAVLKYKRFPGGGARHCTDELKITPSKKFYNQFSDYNGGFEVWYGMRSSESSEREKRYSNILDTDLYDPSIVMSKYPKYLGKKGVMFRLPILSWSSDQVFKLLDGEQNPLYNEGFDRVGCFPCLAGGDVWKEKAFAFDSTGNKHYEIVKRIEKQIKKSVFTSKGGAMRNNEEQIGLFQSGPGCKFCEI